MGYFYLLRQTQESRNDYTLCRNGVLSWIPDAWQILVKACSEFHCIGDSQSLYEQHSQNLSLRQEKMKSPNILVSLFFDKMLNLSR